MKNLIFIYGTIAGIVVSLMLVFSFSGGEMDYEQEQFIGYLTMIIAFSTIFIAIKTHRDKNLDGVIGFGKAFKLGLGITLVASVIYVIAWMIISNTIAKDFMSEYFQQSITKLKNSGLPQAEIDEKIAEMEYFRELYKNPLINVGMTFLEIFPVGLVISIISALVLKRKARN